jgi:hypothetical protein
MDVKLVQGVGGWVQGLAAQAVSASGGCRGDSHQRHPGCHHRRLHGHSHQRLVVLSPDPSPQTNPQAMASFKQAQVGLAPSFFIGCLLDYFDFSYHLEMYLLL